LPSAATAVKGGSLAMAMRTKPCSFSWSSLGLSCASAPIAIAATAATAANPPKIIFLMVKLPVPLDVRLWFLVHAVRRDVRPR